MNMPAPCDSSFRLSRRRLLGFSLGAFVLPTALSTAIAAAPKRRARAVILVVLEGGMSQLESWDPKPGAPVEVRGEFGTIATSLPGVQIGEHLPLLAKELHRGNLVRSVHCDARNDHSPGLHLLLTGYENVAAGVALETANYRNPSVGSVLAQRLGVADSSGAPRFVTIPRSTQLSGRVNYNGPSFLGAAFEAFETGDPSRNSRGKGTVPPGLVLTRDLSPVRLRDRMALTDRLNRMRSDLDHDRITVPMVEQYRRAVQVLTGDRLQKALDLERESVVVRRNYGDHFTGRALLLARRLVEAGVTYVVVNTGYAASWDTHANNFRQLKNVLLPPTDRGVAALMRDLDHRGELDDVLVLVAGEMGRTPLVNSSAGRDHWTSAYSVFLAGGGLTRGQVLGATTPDGRYPSSRPTTVHEILATIYHQLGVDPQTVIKDGQGRPFPILPDARPVGELLA